MNHNGFCLVVYVQGMCVLLRVVHTCAGMHVCLERQETGVKCRGRFHCTLVFPTGSPAEPRAH